MAQPTQLYLRRHPTPMPFEDDAIEGFEGGDDDFEDVGYSINPSSYSNRTRRGAYPADDIIDTDENEDENENACVDVDEWHEHRLRNFSEEDEDEGSDTDLEEDVGGGSSEEIHSNLRNWAQDHDGKFGFGRMGSSDVGNPTSKYCRQPSSYSSTSTSNSRRANGNNLSINRLIDNSNRSSLSVSSGPSGSRSNTTQEPEVKLDDLWDQMNMARQMEKGTSEAPEIEEIKIDNDNASESYNDSPYDTPRMYGEEEGENHDDDDDEFGLNNALECGAACGAGDDGLESRAGEDDDDDLVEEDKDDDLSERTDDGDLDVQSRSRFRNNNVSGRDLYDFPPLSPNITLYRPHKRRKSPQRPPALPAWKPYLVDDEASGVGSSGLSSSDKGRAESRKKVEPGMSPKTAELSSSMSKMRLRKAHAASSEGETDDERLRWTGTNGRSRDTLILAPDSPMPPSTRSTMRSSSLAFSRPLHTTTSTTPTTTTAAASSSSSSYNPSTRSGMKRKRSFDDLDFLDEQPDSYLYRRTTRQSSHPLKSSHRHTTSSANNDQSETELSDDDDELVVTKTVDKGKGRAMQMQKEEEGKANGDFDWREMADSLAMRRGSSSRPPRGVAPMATALEMNGSNGTGSSGNRHVIDLTSPTQSSPPPITSSRDKGKGKVTSSNTDAYSKDKGKQPNKSIGSSSSRAQNAPQPSKPFAPAAPVRFNRPSSFGLFDDSDDELFGRSVDGDVDESLDEIHGTSRGNTGAGTDLDAGARNTTLASSPIGIDIEFESDANSSPSRRDEDLSHDGDDEDVILVEEREGARSKARSWDDDDNELVMLDSAGPSSNTRSTTTRPTAYTRPIGSRRTRSTGVRSGGSAANVAPIGTTGHRTESISSIVSRARGLAAASTSGASSNVGGSYRDAGGSSAYRAGASSRTTTRTGTVRHTSHLPQTLSGEPLDVTLSPPGTSSSSTFHSTTYDPASTYNPFLFSYPSTSVPPSSSSSSASTSRRSTRRTTTRPTTTTTTTRKGKTRMIINDDDDDDDDVIALDGRDGSSSRVQVVENLDVDEDYKEDHNGMDSDEIDVDEQLLSRPAVSTSSSSGVAGVRRSTRRARGAAGVTGRSGPVTRSSNSRATGTFSSAGASSSSGSDLDRYTGMSTARRSSASSSRAAAGRATSSALSERERQRWRLSPSPPPYRPQGSTSSAAGGQGDSAAAAGDEPPMTDEMLAQMLQEQEYSALQPPDMREAMDSLSRIIAEAEAEEAAAQQRTRSTRSGRGGRSGRGSGAGSSSSSRAGTRRTSNNSNAGGRSNANSVFDDDPDQRAILEAMGYGDTNNMGAFLHFGGRQRRGGGVARRGGGDVGGALGLGGIGGLRNGMHALFGGGLASNPLNYMNDDELDMSYESLLALSERIGEAKSKGLADYVIKALPTSKYKPGTMSAEEA
ncbi:hypothetical protein HK102_005687, partial [Quaeritorhiza haematococci]